MEPTAALPADGKGTAAHDAVAMLGVEAPMKKVSADEEPSAEEDPAAKQKVSAGEEKPAPSEDPAGKQKKVSAGEKPAPSEDPAGKQKKVSAEEKPAPSEDPAGEDKKAADKGDGAADLPVDMVLAVAARLPSKAAGRSVVLSKTYRERLGEPLFLKSHLAPRSRFFVGDAVPNTVVLQPAAERLRQGYTHLTTIVRPRHFIYDMPVRSAYDDDEEEEEHDGDYYDYAITYFDVGPQQVRTPPPFFYKTVPALDLALLASEGRLLLARSPTHGLFLCNPTEDRCVRLPAPPLVDIDSRRTAAAIRYQLGSWGEIDDFDVVLLSPLPSGHVALQRFATDGGGHGGWVLTDIGEESVVAVLAGVSAPGIYASEPDAFYWIDDHTGSLIQYMVDDHLLSVVSPAPETDGYPSRKGWSLGSTGGVPRLSSFSVAVEAHGFVEIPNMNGIVSVWIKKQTGWVLVKEVSVPVAWVFRLYRGLELPVDVARANGEFLMVKKDRELLWRDLKRDEVEFVSNLYLRDDSKLNRMYSRFKAFSV